MGLDTFRTRLWGKFGKGLTFLLALTMIGSLAGSIFGGSSSSPRLEKGATLPKAQLIGLANASGPISLEAMRGHPVLLNFWATWCGYCVQELPLIEALHAKYASKGLVVVAVSDEAPELIRRWLSRGGAPKLSFPVAYDPNGRLARQLKVRSIPFTVFLDKEGKVAHDVTGVLNEGDAEKVLEGLVK